MSERKSAQYYQALDERLKKLLPDLQRTVPLENWRWFEEWVRAGEYGLAAEVAAEGLLVTDRLADELSREVLATADMMELNTEPIVRLRARLADLT